MVKFSDISKITPVTKVELRMTVFTRSDKVNKRWFEELLDSLIYEGFVQTG